MPRTPLIHLAFAAAVLGLVNCAAEVPLAKIKYDLAAKRFSRPPDDRANIFVFRNGSTSKVIKLFIDGVPAGALGSYSYAVLTVRPGQHTLLTHEGRAVSSMLLKIQGGLNYYVAKRSASGTAAAGAMAGGVVGAGLANGIAESTPDLELVDREDGRAGVRNCYLIEEVPPALPPLPKSAAPKESDQDDGLPPGW